MAAHQAPPSLGFSRQEHWSGLPFPSPMHESEKWKWSRSVVSNSSRPHGLQPTSPWDLPGKSTGVGCHCLLLRPQQTQAGTCLTLQGCRHFLACVVQHRLNSLGHPTPSHWALTWRASGNLGKLCGFGLKVKWSVLDFRKLSLRNTKRAHKGCLEGWLAVGLLMQLQKHILSCYLIT